MSWAALLHLITIWGNKVLAARPCMCPYFQEALNAKRSQPPVNTMLISDA